jgi:hypothetical protein
LACQALEQHATRHETLATFAKCAHHEITVVQRRRADANCDVDRLTDDIAATVRRLELHFDARVLREERGKHVANVHIQQCNRARDPDAAARFGTRQVNRLLGRLGLDQHRFAVCVVILANLRHGKPARRTLNQPHAKPIFEQRNTPAELRFRHADGAASRCEAAVVDHLGEVIKVIEVLHPASIVHDSEH